MKHEYKCIISIFFQMVNNYFCKLILNFLILHERLKYEFDLSKKFENSVKSIQ
jgi:hypothetical protein